DPSYSRPTVPFGGSGMKCPRCQQQNPPAMKFCGGCGTPLERSSRSESSASYADLRRDLADALSHETATSEILRVISTFPTDLQPVLDAMAENAARLCQSLDADIRRRDGDLLRLVAHYGSIPVSEFTLPIRGTVAGRAVLEGRTLQVADILAESGQF